MSAAARYDELVVRHPEAFVDHAAEFWLTVVAIRPRAGTRALQPGTSHSGQRAHGLANLDMTTG